MYLDLKELTPEQNMMDTHNAGLYNQFVCLNGSQLAKMKE